MKPFVKPKKKAATAPRSVVGAATPDSQLAVHPATRARDAKSLEKVQQARALKPPTKRAPSR